MALFRPTAHSALWSYARDLTYSFSLFARYLAQVKRQGAYVVALVSSGTALTLLPASNKRCGLGWLSALRYAALVNATVEQLIANHDHIGAWIGESMDNTVRGVLFVHATWSGSSVLALSRLTSVCQENRDLLYLLDTDHVPAPLRLQLAPLHGRGETFWLDEGRIIGRINDYGVNWELDVRFHNGRLNKLESGSRI
jgi:hypothetical protein